METTHQKRDSRILILLIVLPFLLAGLLSLLSPSGFLHKQSIVRMQQDIPNWHPLNTAITQIMGYVVK